MSDHSKPSQYDASSPGGLDTKLIAMVGLISVALFIVTVVATETWFYNQQDKVNVENARFANPELQAQSDEQDARLNHVNKIEGDDAHVTIPIDRAIARFVEGRGKE